MISRYIILQTIHDNNDCILRSSLMNTLDVDSVEEFELCIFKLKANRHIIVMGEGELRSMDKLLEAPEYSDASYTITSIGLQALIRYSENISATKKTNFRFWLPWLIPAGVAIVVILKFFLP